MSRELAQHLALALREAGVSTMFGVPGGGPNLDMIGAAQEQGIDFILAHNESAACIMASCFGRITQTAGVAITTRGPGLTNAVNGLAQATLDRFPLVLITDAVTREQSTRVAHQRLDQVSVAQPVCKWSGVLGTDEPQTVVREAVSLALESPRGAVLLSFDPTQPGEKIRSEKVSPPMSRDLSPEILQRLHKAKRPLVIIGLDAIASTELLREALRDAHVPLLVTYEAKGLIPESWPTYSGFFTGVAAEYPLLSQADLIIGIGLDSVEPMPGPWPHSAEVILLHSHPVETAYFGDPSLIVGPYASLLPEFATIFQTQWPETFSRPMLSAELLALESNSALTPQDVVRLTQQAFPDALATVDAGAHMLVVMALWSSHTPNEVLISNGLATMGFSLPAAIAMALANPLRKVVCFVGDGGLGMVLAEIEVICRLQLNIVIVVFNDATLTLIQLKQGEGHGGSLAVGYAPTDFASVASAMGVQSVVVQDRDEMRAALDSLGQGPSLLDCRINSTDYVDIMRVARG